MGEIELAGRSETQDLRESLMNLSDVEAGLSQEAHSLSRFSSRERGRRSKFFSEIAQTLELFTSRSADRLHSQHGGFEVSEDSDRIRDGDGRSGPESGKASSHGARRSDDHSPSPSC